MALTARSVGAPAPDELEYADKPFGQANRLPTRSPTLVCGGGQSIRLPVSHFEAFFRCS